MPIAALDLISSFYLSRSIPYTFPIHTVGNPAGFLVKFRIGRDGIPISCFKCQNRRRKSERDSIGGRSGSDSTRMVWNMVKFVMLLILVGLIVASADCRIPKMGDNVTIVVGVNQSMSGIIRSMPINFIFV